MAGQRTEGHTPSSLILTFFGAYGRAECAGRVAVAALIRLLGAADVDPQSVRSAVSRLKRRGLLVADQTAVYRLSADATEMLADGDRRIYRDASAPAEGGWVLVVFSVPETERHKRHLLRSRLSRLGFGTAAPGVWIAPAHLHQEARHTLERLGLGSYVDLFHGSHTGFTPTREAVRRWWDLDALAALHRAFLAEQEPVLTAWARRSSVRRPKDAFRDYLRALDSWRRLPYADPGLPAELLPGDWPGGRAAQVFGELHERLREPGAEFVRAVHRMT
ncbi:PaaX family transcriptional regulator C-terminal domain-containing protein [Streptantibioticus rubrisoli]|uniref:PaaX family transcriptional regulator n=1 Tax=Streptantibioticus rubrisoli TaxID=1387313 RepID=A0ABT1PKH2_9ACTN|nr:PaaX family transcriptional regulator C-terminal domain-containing protein [Streptantibioticus rubrisoli]MCQ4045861.1 PaaX family transcriptional regulator [Streptantibioticus rubrisoli]